MSISLSGGVEHPKVYIYTVDAFSELPWKGKREGKGYFKVGFTKRDVMVRFKEQMASIKMPIATEPRQLAVEPAITDDGRVFDDHEVHRALERAGYRRDEGEWFECTREEALAAIQAVRQGVDLPSVLPVATFAMRQEQRRAVDQTAEYFLAHPRTEERKAPDYLWNAKMRFGKTFTAYQIARKLGWTRILVLTYKPAVEKAWRDDLRHKDFAGWRFHAKDDPAPDLSDKSPLVWFASFQDVLGKDGSGGAKQKNLDLYQVDWDVVIVDEYHFGAWRDAAKALYVGEVDDISGEKTEGDKSAKKLEDTPDLEDGFVEAVEEALNSSFQVKHYLYLSGTPFRALTEGEFLEDQVFNWTYSDEQKAKMEWPSKPNPYASLPQMHLLAYEMPEALKEVAKNRMSEFSLTEFFRTTKDDSGKHKFVHENEVQKWLNLLQGQDLSYLWSAVSTEYAPMPYADTNLLTALQHTLWYLPGVSACQAMADLLARPHNNFFHQYKVIVAAGPEAGMGDDALDPVEEAITRLPQSTKTITLTVAKLLTGVTVPAWGGILMLRELQSPETYFQAAFRVQSPWAYKTVNTIEGGEDEVVVKHHCYVIDFSPNRALRLMVDYATKLIPSTGSKTDLEASLSEFMEFLPVLAFDGSMMSRVSPSEVMYRLTSGITPSALARRWNSTELVTLDIRSYESILADEKLIESLENIEMWRGISNDLSALISTNKELKPKKLAQEKLNADEKKKEDGAKKRHEGIRDKLRRFLTRVPLFMYLTDHREKAVVDIIMQDPVFFEKVTTLPLESFRRLLDAGAFHTAKMDDAVRKFRHYEEPSLTYGEPQEVSMRGGWNYAYDERLAQLFDLGLLKAGDILTSLDSVNPVTATLTANYGLIVDGVRQENPDQAATSATGEQALDGWKFWHLQRDGLEPASLEDLRASTIVT